MKKLYCSRDSVSCTWQVPQAFNNDEEAKRSFCWALASCGAPDSFLKDLDLYCIGTFDETNGHVHNLEPIHIINGSNDLVNSYRDTISYLEHTEVISDEIPKKEN